MKRLFYPRGMKLSEEFINAFHREYDRLIGEGLNPKTLVERVGKAMKFHAGETRKYHKLDETSANQRIADAKAAAKRASSKKDRKEGKKEAKRGGLQQDPGKQGNIEVEEGMAGPGQGPFKIRPREGAKAPDGRPLHPKTGRPMGQTKERRAAQLYDAETNRRAGASNEPRRVRGGGDSGITRS